MTAEEKFLREQIPMIVGERDVAGMKLSTLISLLREYASQQRTDGIREGFEAARERMVNDTIEGTFYTPVYSTVEDYLNQKK